MFKTLLLPVDLSAEASWKHALPAALKLCNPDSVLHVVTVGARFRPCRWWAAISSRASRNAP